MNLVDFYDNNPTIGILPSGPASLAVIGLVFIGGLLAGGAIGPVTANREGGTRALVRGDAEPVLALPVSTMSYPAEVTRVIDGDTFEARVRIWPGHDVTTRVRLRSIDAPEMQARCRDERRPYPGGSVNPQDRRCWRCDARRRVARAYSGGRRDGWCGTNARG